MAQTLQVLKVLVFPLQISSQVLIALLDILIIPILQVAEILKKIKTLLQ